MTTWRVLTALVLTAVLGACASGPSPAPSVEDGKGSPPPATPTPAPTLLPTPVPIACADVAAPTASQGPDALARPAVPALLDLFDAAPIVAVGEIHGWQAEHDVLAALVCDARFPEVVDAVVVEFGNSRLQAILDRYVVEGETVTRAELQSVWKESTQRSGVWDHPVYERFISLVRAVNQALPRDERVRVLAGDPPVDLATVTQFTNCSDTDPTCMDHWLFQRNEAFAQVVVDEVLANDEAALLIAGTGHMLPSGGPPFPASIPELVEMAVPGATRVVIPHEGLGDPGADPERTIRAWPVPSLAILAGSWLGDLDACLLDGPCDAGGGPTLAEAADAYLYVGPR